MKYATCRCSTWKSFSPISRGRWIPMSLSAAALMCRLKTSRFVIQKLAAMSRRESGLLSHHAVLIWSEVRGHEQAELYTLTEDIWLHIKWLRKIGQETVNRLKYACPGRSLLFLTIKSNYLVLWSLPTKSHSEDTRGWLSSDWDDPPGEARLGVRSGECILWWPADVSVSAPTLGCLLRTLTGLYGRQSGQATLELLLFI